MPASGCEIIANVRREAIWSASGATGVLSMGAPAAMYAEKWPAMRANAYEQCIISQAAQRSGVSNKIPDKSTFFERLCYFFLQNANRACYIRNAPVTADSAFFKTAWGTHRRPLLMSRAQRGGVLHAGSFFPSQPNTKTHLEQSGFCCHFALSCDLATFCIALRPFKSLQPVSLSLAPPRSHTPTASSHPSEGVP